MKKNITILIGIAVWGFIMPSTAYAQLSRIAKQRIVMDEAISTIEDYETFATIADEETRYSFKNLFVNDSASVYNDLLGIYKGESLTAKDYCKLLSDGLRSKKAIIKNIKKDDIHYENGMWKVKFSFDKTMSYTNKCGVFFSSTDFFEKDYHLTATLVYDDLTGDCN